MVGEYVMTEHHCTGDSVVSDPIGLAAYTMDSHNCQRIVVDGVVKNDLQQNWRTGFTLALPVNRKHSIKLFGSSGVSTRTGNNYDALGITWQYRWGGGI